MRRRRRKLEIRIAKPEVRDGAFTLAELLIAIGLLGICVTMAAGLFPVAIKEHEKSVRNTIGTTICENALACVRAARNGPKLRANCTRLWDLPSPSVTTPLPSGWPPPEVQGDWVFDKQDLAWKPDREKGCIVLGREIGGNDYQLIAVAYTKADALNSVESTTFGVDNPGENLMSLTTTDKPEVLRAGNVVIVPGSAQYALITSVSGDTAELDRPITVPGGSVITLIEKDTLGDIVPRNPVIAVMSTRTGLRSQANS